MKFGPVPPSRIPKQDPAKVLRVAERWQRAAYAQQKWAGPAKRGVDFFEGRQWTEEQLRAMARGKRPALTFNIIAPIVRLVLGYQRSNKTDITFDPGQDTLSSENVAEALSAVEKAIARMNHQEFVDCEVFLDGLISARGFFDTRLDFTGSDLGDVKTIGADPFTVYPDPDGNTYDLYESCAFVDTSKFVSIDEIEDGFGRKVADLVRPFTMGQTPLSPISSALVQDEVMPVRGFALREDFSQDAWWDNFYNLMGDFVDPHRKTIRIIESQYKVREPRNVVIDLETGDKKTLPEDWGQDKIDKMLLWTEIQGSPCTVQRRMVERVQWTVTVGDVILYDAPSLYDRYTLTGYFPYFRRGFTRGMVEDLIDPQLDKNKHRSARFEIAAKTANGGWKYHVDSMDPVQEANLKKFGAAPGVNIKWKGTVPPEQIQPGQPSQAHAQLEEQSQEDIHAISGINESALGEYEKVASGRALEARQRQATVSVQMYMDNFKRSKMLLGGNHLNIIQNHYTERRLFRISGEDGNVAPVIINQIILNPASGGKMIQNDVTLGKYMVAIDDAPLSATYQDAQFQEMMELLDKLGPAIGGYLPLFADLIIGMSSMPRKKEWIDRLQQIAGAGQPPPGAPGPGGPQPHPGGPPPQMAQPVQV